MRGRWLAEILTADGVLIRRERYKTHTVEGAIRLFRELWRYFARSPEMRAARRVEFFHTAPGGDPCGRAVKVIWI